MGSKTTTEVKQMPEFQETFLKDTLLPIAEEIGTRKYEGYTGERVAAPTELQEQAYGAYQGLTLPSEIAQSAQIASDIATRDPQQTQQRLQEIQNLQAPLLNRQFAQQGVGQEAQAIKAGAFGDRRSVYEGERQAALDAQSYNMALKQLQAEDAARMQAAGAAAGAGLQGLQTQQAIAAAQMGAGEARRQLAQQGLDVGYQDYLDERNFPLSNFGVLTGAAGAIPQGYGTFTTTSRDPMGALGMGLQAFGGLGVGGFGPFSGFGDQNLTFNPLGGLYGGRN